MKTDDELFEVSNKIENYLRKLLREGDIDKDYYAKFMMVNMEMLEDGVDEDDFDLYNYTLSKKYEAKLKSVDSKQKGDYTDIKGSKKR